MKVVLLLLLLTSCITDGPKVRYGDYVQLAGFYGMCCARVIGYDPYALLPYTASVTCPSGVFSKEKDEFDVRFNDDAATRITRKECQYIVYGEPKNKLK